MVCVESGNVGKSKIKLPPGKSSTLTVKAIQYGVARLSKSLVWDDQTATIGQLMLSSSFGLFPLPLQYLILGQ